MGLLNKIFGRKKKTKQKPKTTRPPRSPYKHYWEIEREEKLAKKYENETADTLQLFKELQTKAGGIPITYLSKREWMKYKKDQVNAKKFSTNKCHLYIKWEFNKYFPAWEEGDIVCFNFFEKQRSGRYYFGKDADDIFAIVTEVRFDRFGGSDKQPCLYTKLKFID